MKKKEFLQIISLSFALDIDISNTHALLDIVTHWLQTPHQPEHILFVEDS